MPVTRPGPTGSPALRRARAKCRATRMLGLAHLDPAPDGRGLLIPGCRSVHTFGMRFAIDIHFIDRDGDVIRSEMAVKPRRMLYCRRACAVLELQSAPV